MAVTPGEQPINEAKGQLDEDEERLRRLVGRMSILDRDDEVTGVYEPHLSPLNVQAFQRNLRRRTVREREAGDSLGY